MGGKAEKGTPKYLANKMKAKGLQKLRWYCQMCQKQCRDENGFKCHTMSESHQRQLLLFADNASKYIGQFSREFAEGYLELLKRQCGTKRVNANKIYQDYISHRDHYHMNATQWETLTDFVKWLGREGKCTVDETEKGWFVAYIDRDPATIAAQEAQAKKDKMDKDDQDRMQHFIEKQVKRGKNAFSVEEPTYTELKRSSSQEKLTLNLNLKRKTEESKPMSSTSAFKLLRKEDSSKKKEGQGSKKNSTLEEIIKMDERAKEKANRKDYWLTEDIIVKVVTKSLGSDYYNKKGAVKRVIDKYCAEIQLLDGGKRLKLDQNHLETVIPSVGRAVRFVNGAYRGLSGVLKSIKSEEFCCEVEITEGLLTGRRVKSVQYEDICKTA